MILGLYLFCVGFVTALVVSEDTIRGGYTYKDYIQMTLSIVFAPIVVILNIYYFIYRRYFMK